MPLKKKWFYYFFDPPIRQLIDKTVYVFVVKIDVGVGYNLIINKI
jgi:hypothetical protein